MFLVLLEEHFPRKKIGLGFHNVLLVDVLNYRIGSLPLKLEYGGMSKPIPGHRVCELLLHCLVSEKSGGQKCTCLAISVYQDVVKGTLYTFI